MKNHNERIRIAENIIAYETKDGLKYHVVKRYNNNQVNKTFNTLEKAKRFLENIEHMTKIHNFDYPLTFIEAIFNKESNVDIEYIEKNFHENIKHLLETMSEREQQVLHKRFVEGYTLKATGLQMGVTPERIRQIEAKALRRIKVPARLQYLTRGHEYMSLREDVAKLTVDLEKERARLLYLLANPEKIEISKDEISNNYPLEMLDLSVRSYNSLRRSGIKTLGEIIIKDEWELRRIRGMGSKSVKEIKEKLQELGFSLQETNYKD